MSANAINFDFTKENYCKAMQSIALQQAKSTIYTVLACILIVAVLSLYGFWLNGSTDTFFSWLPFLLLVITFYSFVIWGSPYFQSRSVLNKNIFQKSTIAFASEQLILTLENRFSVVLPYRHIVKAVNNDRHAFYWTNSVDAVIVPMHPFSSASAYREQVGSIQSKLKI